MHTIEHAPLLHPTLTSIQSIQCKFSWPTRYVCHDGCIIVQRCWHWIANSRVYLFVLQGLVHWCSRTNDFRGLERWTCREYAVARSKHANEVKHAVLLEQARQFLLKEQDDEVIARVAQREIQKRVGVCGLVGTSRHNGSQTRGASHNKEFS